MKYYFILSCGNHYIIKIIFGKNILEINIYFKNNNKFYLLLKINYIFLFFIDNSILDKKYIFIFEL